MNDAIDASCTKAHRNGDLRGWSRVGPQLAKSCATLGLTWMSNHAISTTAPGNTVLQFQQRDAYFSYAMHKVESCTIGNFKTRRPSWVYLDVNVLID